MHGRECVGVLMRREGAIESAWECGLGGSVDQECVGVRDEDGMCNRECRGTTGENGVHDRELIGLQTRTDCVIDSALNYR